MDLSVGKLLGARTIWDSTPTPSPTPVSLLQFCWFYLVHVTLVIRVKYLLGKHVYTYTCEGNQLVKTLEKNAWKSSTCRQWEWLMGWPIDGGCVFHFLEDEMYLMWKLSRIYHQLYVVTHWSRSTWNKHTDAFCVLDIYSCTLWLSFVYEHLE